MNEIIYIGGNGKLAKYFEINTNFTITKRLKNNDNYLDLVDFNNSKFKNYTNKLFIFGAAISSPNQCQNNQIECVKINYTYTANVIEHLLKKNRVLFLSSDLVFDGQKDDVLCNEYTHTKPKNLYSKLKVQIENKFLNDPNFYIARLSYVLFKENSFFEYLDSCLKRNIKPNIIHPVIRHCTQPEKIVEYVNHLFDNNNVPKIYHIAGKPKSKLDLLDEWEKQRKVKILYDTININESIMREFPSKINFITEIIL